MCNQNEAKRQVQNHFSFIHTKPIADNVLSITKKHLKQSGPTVEHFTKLDPTIQTRDKYYSAQQQHQYSLQIIFKCKPAQCKMSGMRFIKKNIYKCMHYNIISKLTSIAFQRHHFIAFHCSSHAKYNYNGTSSSTNKNYSQQSD